MQVSFVSAALDWYQETDALGKSERGLLGGGTSEAGMSGRLRALGLRLGWW